MRIVKLLRILALAGLVMLGVGGYLFTSVAVNGQPNQVAYSGWVAVLGEDLIEKKHQVRLTVEAVEAGAPGENPRLVYSVAICGANPFHGYLLTGGDARLTTHESPEDVPKALGAILNSAPIEDLTVAWDGGGTVSELADVEAAPLNIDSPPVCVSESLGSSEWLFTGSLVSLVGRARAPIQQTVALGPVEGPRTSLRFPLVGGIPGIPSGALGVFHFSGGLNGTFTHPISDFDVRAGALNAVVDVEGVSPAPAADRSLAWTSSRPVAPWIRFVNTQQMSYWQSLQVAMAIILGVATSIVATVLMRDRYSASRQPAAVAPPSEENEGVNQTSESRVAKGDDGKAGRPSALAWVATILVVLWGIRKRPNRRRVGTDDATQERFRSTREGQPGPRP